MQLECQKPLDKIRITHTESDRYISAEFQSPKGIHNNIVTWNPVAMKCLNVPGSTLLGDSSQIPNEILDGILMKPGTPENVKKAFIGAWYEAMEIMAGHGKRSKEMLKYMAKKSAVTLPEYKQMLRKTKMFYDPRNAIDIMEGNGLKQAMEHVREFTWDNNLYPRGMQKDAVGIKFPDGTVSGNEKYIGLKFNPKYMQMAVEGKL
jgi:NitT/TauT family transport system substrate-binding protein